MRACLERGIAHHKAGRHLDAQNAYLEALALHPRHPDALRLLGLLALDSGEGETALRLLETALRLAPLPAAFCDLGRARLRLGRPLEAAAAFLEAARRDPAMTTARLDAGVALRLGGRRVEAAALLLEAADKLPDSLPAALNAALVLIDLKRHAEAEPLIARAESLLAGLAQPSPAVASQILAARAMCLRHRHQLEAAASVLEEARRLDPRGLVPLGNLAMIRLLQGRAAEAVALFDHALTLAPTHLETISNRLLAAQYLPGATAADLDRLHRALAPRLEGPAATPAVTPFANPPEPDRRLRVGYVSPDFGNHPVGTFLAAVLPFHDPAAVAVTCYSDRDLEDELTARLRACPVTWVRTRALDHAALGQRIRDDGIDILIDLAGFTAGNRLPVFARRAAPVQLTWAGYVGTTGLAAMDGLIADRFHVPAGEERHYRETIHRLPDGYVAWAPPDYGDPVAPLPMLAATDGRPTFGCLNSLTKLSPATVALWARVLAAVPAAGLYLKTDALGDAATADLVRAAFAAAGVDPGRLTLEGRTPRRAHLAAYGRVDVALDPLPYVGGVTTLEALWMGVPTVTLPGASFAGRHSLSHLSNAGAAPWCVAGDADDYVAKAAALVADPAALAALRPRWRERLAASPLCDGAAFTRHLETVFRRAWQAWCARQHRS